MEIYGGFARSLVMGKLHCNDIDIWFTAPEQRDKFICLMLEKCKPDTLKYPYDDKHRFDYNFERKIARWETSNYVPTNMEEGYPDAAIELDMAVSYFCL